MKNIILVLTFFFCSSVCVQAQADDVTGIWMPAKGTSQVRIYKETNGKYCGKVEWKKEDKDELDVNNPDERLRNNKILGMIILKDFVYNNEKK